MDSNNLHFTSSLKENEKKANIPPRKFARIIPSREDNILEKKTEIPTRVTNILNDTLIKRSENSVEDEIIESWKVLKSKYDLSAMVDMIIDDLYNWMYLSNHNRCFVYNKLLEQLNDIEDSEEKDQIVEYLYKLLDKYK